MQKFKKISIVLFIAILTFVLSCEVNATSNKKDGLVANLITDKKEYDQDESINATLSIENTNEYVVFLSNVETMVPDGFVLEENSINKLEKRELNIGEKIQLQTKIKEKEISIVNTENKTNDSKTDIIINNQIDTSDSNQLEWYIILIGMSMCIIFILNRRKKGIKKSVYILLVFTLISTIFTNNVQAKEIKNQIHINESIKYEGKELILTSKIDYKYELNDPKEPIVYQDGIEESFLEYTLDEKDAQIIVSDGNDVSKWKIGEIHVLKNIVNPSDDIAIEIKSINQLEDGRVLIKYDTPEFSKVIKSIDYSGIESQNGILKPAEGIEFKEKGVQKNLRSAAQSYSLNFDENGTFDLFATYDFHPKNTDIYGELCIERINFDFNIDADMIRGINVNKLYVTLDSSLKIGLDSSSNFGGEKKVNIASYEAYIGYGFFAEGNIYLYLSANGELSLEYTFNVSCGFDYSNSIFKGIWDFQSKLTKAKADANVKIGAIAEPKISVLKLGLVSAEFDYGRNYELKLDEVSISPLEYCIDAGYYNYATVSSIFLPGTWNKKFTTTLMDEDNSHMKDNSHLEEIGVVKECTRKYGSLEGQVLKHAGDENVPLYLAKVTLEKNKEIKYETKTGSEGKFTFGKEIEKGTYDIFVRSNYYETYQGQIKILGNKENKIKDPIVLEPYAKSIVVTGKVLKKNTDQPLSNATVSVKDYPDRVGYTDVLGNYSIKVPLGQQTLVASLKNYGSTTYTNNFTTDLNDINFELGRKYDFEVKEIRAGESYQFDFTSPKRIFVRAEESTEYSSYLDGDVTYHRADYDGEFYRGVNAGSHWEIKVFSGSLTVFASDGSFWDSPDSDLSNYCTYSSMNGNDPFVTYRISSGNSLTFDNKVDKPKTTPYTIYCYSNDNIIGTETVTDYYYSTHFGWEPGINIYDLNGKQRFWRPINNLSKCTISITSGELIVYHYRLDPITVY